jgi:hypothetical protein
VPKRLLVVGLGVGLSLLLEGTLGCGVEFQACEEECQTLEEGASSTNSYVCSCSCTPDGRSEESPVVASEDDANEDGTGATNPTAVAVRIRGGSPAGIRFDDVMIPPGATIDSAVVEFQVANDDADALEVEIFGEASPDAPPFAAVANDISSRPVVASSVPGWTPGAWVAGNTEFSPDLAAVLQDVIDQPGWAEGNAVVLIFQGVSIDGRRRAESYDGNPQQAPVLRVAYTEAAPFVSQELRVCAQAGDNPNLGGSLDPGEAEADCAGRVTDTLAGLAGACGYPTGCSCSVVSGSSEFAEVCDDPCNEVPLDPGCSNFDPVGSSTGATNAPGDAPVCIANSPIAYGVFGRRTECAVAGQATVDVDGDTGFPSAGGVVRFVGDPCPGQSCAVGMEYDLDIGDVTFGNAFGSETFSDLSGVGANVAGSEAVLSPAGAGTFGSESVRVSARGVREGEQAAVIAVNDDVIQVSAVFGSVGPTCAVSGSLLGSVDPELMRCENAGPSADQICDEDSDCTNDPGCSNGTCNCETVSEADLTLSLAVGGPITNQPPFADAGADQTVECPAFPVLDGSASSDLDSNIALYSWRRGSRIGEEVGHRVIETVPQSLGTETYVLRVIDEASQAHEDTTLATVEDTTPPELTCAVAVSQITDFNHVMHDVGLTGDAQDACEGDLPVTVTVYGDEDDEEPTGEGVFSPDAAAIDLETLHLRGERRGDADGRVYLILVEATDSSGNRGVDCCTVTVPHGKNQASKAAVEAQAAAARAECLANEAPPAGYFVVGDGPVIGPKCGVGPGLVLVLPLLVTWRRRRARR